MEESQVDCKNHWCFISLMINLTFNILDFVCIYYWLEKEIHFNLLKISSTYHKINQKNCVNIFWSIPLKLFVFYILYDLLQFFFCKIFFRKMMVTTKELFIFLMTVERRLTRFIFPPSRQTGYYIIWCILHYIFYIK